MPVHFDYHGAVRGSRNIRWRTSVWNHAHCSRLVNGPLLHGLGSQRFGVSHSSEMIKPTLTSGETRYDIPHPFHRPVRWQMGAVVIIVVVHNPCVWRQMRPAVRELAESCCPRHYHQVVYKPYSVAYTHRSHQPYIVVAPRHIKPNSESWCHFLDRCHLHLQKIPCWQPWPYKLNIKHVSDDRQISINSAYMRENDAYMLSKTRMVEKRTHTSSTHRRNYLTVCR